MTEPDVLPTDRLNAAQLNYLTQDLAEKYAAGMDLGSRVPHIHEASATIQQLWRQPESDIGKLRRMGVIGADDRIHDLIRMATCELSTIKKFTRNQ